MPFPQSLLFEGRLAPKDITVTVDTQTRQTYPASLEAEIEESWQGQLREARQKGYGLWDSPCYRLNGVHGHDGNLGLSLGLIDYRYVRGTIPLADAGRLPEEFASRQMYSSLLVRTSDGMYVFGTGSDQYYIGELKFVGGVYSHAEHVVTDSESLFQGAVNELEEELNVSRDAVASMCLRAIFATPRGLRDLCFEVALGISSEEVRKLFAERKDKELADILVFDKAQAYRAVSSLKDRRCEKAALIG